MLALEGLGNFFSLFSHPIAALWLLAKIVFIAGFVKRWGPVYYVFLAVTALHVVSFALAGAPGIAIINAVIGALVAFQHSWFFPTDQALNTGTVTFPAEDGNPYRAAS